MFGAAWNLFWAALIVAHFHPVLSAPTPVPKLEEEAPKPKQAPVHALAPVPAPVQAPVQKVTQRRKAEGHLSHKEQRREKYEAALKDAEAVVGRLEAMHIDLLHGMANSSSLEAHFDKIRSLADEAPMWRGEKHEDFDRLARAAEAAIDHAKQDQDVANATESLRQAREALDELHETAGALDRFAMVRNRNLHRLVQKQIREANEYVKHVTSKSEHLARVARRRIDHLDSLARASGEPDVADALDAKVESEVNKVRAVAEDMARRIAAVAEESEEDAQHEIHRKAEVRRKQLKEIRSQVQYARKRVTARTLAASNAAGTSAPLFPTILMLSASSALVGGLASLFGATALKQLRGRSRLGLQEGLLAP